MQGLGERLRADCSPLEAQYHLTLQALPLYYECLRSIPFNLFHMLAPVKKVLYVFDQEKSFAI
jgi:hypothetical protein